MAIKTIALIGDSLTQGDAYNFSFGYGGLGKWSELVAERLANIQGYGPLISSGFIGVGDSVIFGSSLCWSGYSGSWTAVTSTDAFDKLWYGQGKYSAAGSTATTTFTRPTYWRTPVGFAIYFVDYSGGGNWQYRVNGGAWTNHGQTLAHNNNVIKFYVPGAADTIDFRAYNGTSSAGCFPAGVELFWSDPTTPNVSGLIVHNFAVGATTLNSTVITTSGDRLAILDSIQLGTGSPPVTTPNSGTIIMHINDVTVITNTTTWASNLTTAYNRASPLGPVGFMSPWEAVTVGNRTPTNQANYRAQTKTTAHSQGIQVLDFYDLWTANGWGSGVGTQNAVLSAVGLLQDGTHETQLAHLDLAERIYGWLRQKILTGVTTGASNYVAKANTSATIYTGKRSTVAYTASPPIVIK